MAADIKLDKLELNPSRTGGANARIDAVERIMQRNIDAQGVNTLMREMIEPDRKLMEPLRKMQVEARETVINPAQIGEFTRLSYNVDTNLLSTEEQNVVLSIKRRTGQKFKAPKAEKKEIGYRASQEKEAETGYRKETTGYTRRA